MSRRRIQQEDNVLSLENSVQNAPVQGGAGMSNTRALSEDILASILASLEDDKAEDLVEISLRGKSTIADYMVIASGRSTRQVSSMAEKLTDKLKQNLGVLCKVEGADVGDWVLIDAGDVIVHIFRPEVREFYQLEKMWQASEAAAKAR